MGVYGQKPKLHDKSIFSSMRPLLRRKKGRIEEKSDLSCSLRDFYKFRNQKWRNQKFRIENAVSKYAVSKFDRILMKKQSVIIWLCVCVMLLLRF